MSQKHKVFSGCADFVPMGFIPGVFCGGGVINWAFQNEELLNSASGSGRLTGRLNLPP
jgi:hypothetical protein